MHILLKKLRKTIQICNRKKTGQKSAKKYDLGASGAPFGRVWKRFWEASEALGASWVDFGGLFFMLVFAVVFKSGLGGFWNRFWLDFGRFGEA